MLLPTHTCRFSLTRSQNLQVSLLAIRERELNLYSDNFRNIGTQAALLAGFAYSGCTITTDLNDNDYERAIYIFITTGAMSLNVSEHGTFFSRSKQTHSASTSSRNGNVNGPRYAMYAAHSKTAPVRFR